MGTYFGVLAMDELKMYQAVIMIVVCLSVFSVFLDVKVLHQTIHLKDIIGLMFAIASVILLSIKTGS